MDRLEHRHVVVDDEIEDGVEDIIFAMREYRRAGLAPLAHGRV
jgi:hypothetical protein